jgi:hypothetical protein
LDNRPGYGTTSNSYVCQNRVVLESWLKDFNSSRKGLPYFVRNFSETVSGY